MDRGMKIAVACLLVGVLALGAIVPFSAESYRTYNTSVELPEDDGDYSPYQDPSNNVLPYEQIREDVRSVYVDTLENNGTITRDLRDAVGNWPFNESKNLVIDRRGVDSLPSADEDDPDSRYDAMMVDTKTADQPLGGDLVPLLLEVIGIGGVAVGVAVGFFSE